MPLTPETIVRNFLAAWPRKDIGELVSYFAEDAVYHNIPVPPVVGREAIRKTFEGFLGAFDIVLDVLHLGTSGNLVFTERVDRFTMNGKKFDLPVNGVFELRNGKIVSFRDYFVKGNPRLHAIGLLGGMIWNTGMSFNIIAAPTAGPALAYGLGQGATMIGAFWSVFIWREFKGAPPGTNKLLAAMFLFYLLGLGILIASKL